MTLLKSSLIMAAGAALAWGGATVPAQDGEVGNSDVCVIDASTVLPNAMVTDGDLHRVKPLMATLPEGYSARIEFTTFGAGGVGKPKRYPCRFTPLDANGKPDGLEVAYANWYQKPMRATPFVHGVRHGVERLYSGNGEVLLAEIPWVEGTIHGTKKTYHPEGEFASESTYEHGKVVGGTRSYARDGQLIRVAQFKEGERDGEVVDYWPGREGVVQRVIPYKAGVVDGLCKAFYADGSLKWERPFRDNEMHGVERHYAPDGTVGKERYWIHAEQVTADEFKDRF